MLGHVELADCFAHGFLNDLDPRFQRGRISGAPVSVLPKKAKFSSTSGLLKNGAAREKTCHSSQVFQSASGTESSIPAMALK